MLSGLAVFATLTALVAGVIGAWSPCGFSMVDTIGSTLGDARRSITLGACATFTLGALLGGVLTFGGLATAGRLIGSPAGAPREALGAILALAAAIADWRGLKIAPQIRRQVPERWRWRMPLPVACGLYGVLLGLGFTTFVLSFAVWALAGISFAAGSPVLGALVGLAFGAGRALPVLWMAPGMSRAGASRLEGMASEPRLWLGLRRLDALGLGLCALFLGGASASAAVWHAATDPSAGGGAVVWQRVGGAGMLHAASGHTSVLPGALPALGETSIAWEVGGQITVADLASMAPKAVFAAAGVDALAVSDGWVVYRALQAHGRESLVGLPLVGPPEPHHLAGPRPAGELGRPSLDGAKVVFTLNTPRRSAIEALNLGTGARRVLRSVTRDAQLANPSLLDGRLMYERTDRCSQELRVGAPGGGHHDRVLRRLPSTVRRDPGYERGYEHAYNTASICHNRGTGPGGRLRLGPVAQSAGHVYVTLIPPNPGHARVVAIRP